MFREHCKSCRLPEACAESGMCARHNLIDEIESPDNKNELADDDEEDDLNPELDELNDNADYHIMQHDRKIKENKA